MARSFFGTLGHLAGTGQQENQFSRTFSACFEQSPSFKRQVLNLLRGVCKIRTTLPPAEYECSVEVPTPLPGGGRVDLRIGSTKATRDSLPLFYLESKLESPLTLEQLRRYRKHGIQYLVAVTKHPPAITRKEATKAGVFVLRWQDLHRELLRERALAHSDRFIARSMADYLEDLGMAYRENLTLKDLELFRRILSTAASPKYREISPRNGFEVADACLQLLQDVRQSFCDLHPKLLKYRSWGPGYFVWVDEDGNKYHVLGWDLYKKSWSEWRFACRLWFPNKTSEPISWSSHLAGSSVTDQYDEHSLKSMLVHGTVDQDKLLGSLRKCAKRWGVL
jgi:hypothetical protein